MNRSGRTIQLVQLLMDFAPRGEPMDLTLLAQFGVEARAEFEEAWGRLRRFLRFLRLRDDPTATNIVTLPILPQSSTGAVIPATAAAVPRNLSKN